MKYVGKNFALKFQAIVEKIVKKSLRDTFCCTLYCRQNGATVALCSLYAVLLGFGPIQISKFALKLQKPNRW